MGERWATFDCYGTLIDWNGGVRAELVRVFGDDRADELLDRYHEIEPEVQAEDPERTYRTVLTLALERLAEEEGVALPHGEHDALARSLPSWTPFPEVPAALEEARARGWRTHARLKASSCHYRRRLCNSRFGHSFRATAVLRTQ